MSASVAVWICADVCADVGACSYAYIACVYVFSGTVRLCGSLLLGPYEALPPCIARKASAPFVRQGLFGKTSSKGPSIYMVRT